MLRPLKILVKAHTHEQTKVAEFSRILICDLLYGRVAFGAFRSCHIHRKSHSQRNITHIGGGRLFWLYVVPMSNDVEINYFILFRHRKFLQVKI